MNTLSLSPEEQDTLRGEFAAQLSEHEGMTPLHASIGASTLVELDDFCRSIRIDDHERSEIIDDATSQLAEKIVRVGKLGKIVAVSSLLEQHYKEGIVAADYLFFDSPSTSKR